MSINNLKRVQTVRWTVEALLSVAAILVSVILWKIAQDKHGPRMDVSGTLNSATGQSQFSLRNTGDEPAQAQMQTYAQFELREFRSAEEAGKRLYFAHDLTLIHVDQFQDLNVASLASNMTNLSSERVPTEILTPEDFANERHQATFKTMAEVSKQMHKRVVYVWGAVLNDDRSNNLYLTRFCFEHRPTDPNRWFYCPFLNTSEEHLPKNAECVRPLMNGQVDVSRKVCTEDTSIAEIEASK